MIWPRDVELFVIDAEAARMPGLFGIFCETDLECELVWLYLMASVEGSPGLILNMPQQEVTLCNGVRIRVFCATWRTYVGLVFTHVLISDHTVGDHVKDLIKFRLKIDEQPKKEEAEAPLTFGL